MREEITKGKPTNEDIVGGGSSDDRLVEDERFLNGFTGA